jgi:(p)ppGpp synthase/HD superfamily hydrolase
MACQHTTRENPVPLSPRFSAALAFAAELHGSQTRKGSGTPYIAHLLAVSALVLEHGGNEDEAIAALLHDAVEDQGGLPTLERIRERFGPAVADVVESCSDAVIQPKPPWRQRKEAYVAHLPQAPASVRLVSAADKLHNARALVADYRSHGEALWEWFTASREDTLWYYRAVVTALQEAGSSPLVEELARTVGQLEKLVDSPKEE